MICSTCNYLHVQTTNNKTNNHYNSKVEEAKKNVVDACHRVAFCAKTLAEKNGESFDKFYFEDERVKIMWGGNKMAILKCNGIENGELMKIDDLQRMIYEAYVVSAFPVALN